MSAMLPQVHPEENIVFVVNILRSAPPSCRRGSQCLDTILSQNQKIIDIVTSHPNKKKFCRKIIAAKSNLTWETDDCSEEDSIDEGKMLEEEQHIKSSEGGIGAKQYLPYCKNEVEWKDHFGDKWDRFKELKNKFDPLNVLTPGQRIFKRKSNEDITSS